MFTGVYINCLVYPDLYIRSVYLLDFIKIFFKLNVVVGVDGPKLVNNFTPKIFYFKTKTLELTFFPEEKYLFKVNKKKIELIWHLVVRSQLWR